jgi:hypothetical protein
MSMEAESMFTLKEVLEKLTAEERKKLNDNMIENGDIWLIRELIETIHTVKKEDRVNCER